MGTSRTMRNETSNLISVLQYQMARTQTGVMLVDKAEGNHKER